MSAFLKNALIRGSGATSCSTKSLTTALIAGSPPRLVNSVPLPAPLPEVVVVVLPPDCDPPHAAAIRATSKTLRMTLRIRNRLDAGACGYHITAHGQGPRGQELRHHRREHRDRPKNGDRARRAR